MLQPAFLLATVALGLTIFSGITNKIPDWIGLLILCVAVMVAVYH